MFQEYSALAAVILVTILWLVIGWRAMRAHERLADSIEFLAREQMRNRNQQP